MGGLVRLGPWGAVVLLGAWTAHPSPWWLPAAGAMALLGLFSPRRTRTANLGIALLLLAIPVGLLAHERLRRLTSDWSSYWADREESVSTELGVALGELVERGTRAVGDLVQLAEQEAGRPPQSALQELVDRTGVAAAAVYTPEGRPEVWAGIHRGRVPDAVQLGRANYVYGELPLFSYLYFTEPVVGTGGTVVVAILLRSDLPEDFQDPGGDFASRFSDATGEALSITRGEVPDAGALGPAGLFSVSVVRPAESERRSRVLTRWIRLEFGLIVFVWLLLAVGARARRDEVRRAVVTAVALAVLLPFGSVFGRTDWFGVGVFHLAAGPFELTLGRLLVLLAVVALGLTVWSGGDRLRIQAPWVGVMVGVGFPLAARVVMDGVAPGFLATSTAGWAVFQLALSLLLTVLVGAALLVGGERSPRGRGGVGLAGSLVVAVGLSAAAAVHVSETATLPTYWLVAWAVPAFLAARELTPSPGWRRGAAVWATAVTIGTSAALPAVWQARIDARMTIAEAQMDRLGAEVDPYLNFLLGRLARMSDSLYEEGAGAVELLYHGWIESGLARQGYPVWLTLWGPGGLPQEELPIRVPRDRPVLADRLAREAAERDERIVRRFETADAHYVLAEPLPGGFVLTAVVPPLRDVGTAPLLGPLLGGGGREDDPLTLVPLLPGDVATRGPELEWVRTEQGWRGEMLLVFPGSAEVDGTRIIAGSPERFHAHYLVDLPGPLVVVARATLLLVLNSAVVLALWLAARIGLKGVRFGGGGLRPVFSSFRARITVALFGFFLLSNAIFGTLAYRTIAGAAERAARVLAERVVEDAAAVYNEVGGQMELLAGQVGGADLLEYRDGELREGSTEELVALGLFEGWLPYDVYRLLSAREEVLETRETRLGRWEYMTAFRRLSDGDILSSPVPLQAGATAVRREEVAHLLGFAVVAGGLLSLVLALMVGRTLASPIRTLRVASERVGAGNLGVRLPTDRGDEFGSVFSAFNRMVRRLRRARRDLVRTTRRTQAIVEDVAAGVIALDSSGRVTLANPRAAELLGRSVEVGSRLREEGGAADEFVRWVRLYFRDGLREARTEFQFDDRRLRVRARRISREGSPGSAVLSVEDVTDELRTERVLAWGEMARQVAHEVKNPLTPIKLAIQHIRRAWEDRRADFGEILTRNVDAALGEIDRLAGIASSFSRFGAPEAPGAAPLEPVDVRLVVEQVLALYRSGEGSVQFESEFEDGMPLVKARESEMKEVLVNLLENARAAVDAEGSVCIRAVTGPSAVVLSVRDDGRGIDETFLPRVFEAHFSTRSAGTGLGLAIVKRLVESWDATVSVESTLGEGTVVRIRIRPWDEDGESPGGPDAEGKEEGGPGGEGRGR